MPSPQEMFDTVLIISIISMVLVFLRFATPVIVCYFLGDLCKRLQKDKEEVESEFHILPVPEDENERPE